MARRSSYASVLAGGGASGGTGRSGFLSYPGGSNPSAQLGRSPSSPQPTGRAGSLSQAYSSSARPGDPFDTDDLPPYSSSLGATSMEPRTPQFYIPSYLKHSRHAEKLEEKHKARLKAHRDGGGKQSGGGSLSRTGSGMNLHKMVPSHRGMTYDIQEKFVGFGEEILAPLPTRWSTVDKFNGLDLSTDGFEVTFANQPKNPTTDEAAALRADNPMPKACGIYYYEIEIRSKGRDAPIGVGLSGSKASLNRLPGWESDSWAYHGDDGFVFDQNANSGKAYGHRFGYGDFVGCGINFNTGAVFFTKNGVHLGEAFRNIKSDRLFPFVGMKKSGEKIYANFGQIPFVYDIDGLVERERRRLQNQISAEACAHLHPSVNESNLLQELVGQYLAHEGYTETTRAFSQEVRRTKSLFQNSDAMNSTQTDYKEDEDAIHRQRIRSEILRGDIDAALKHTKAYYPTVLQDNESTYFKLKCRKFIEMIKRSADLTGPPRHKRLNSTGFSHARSRSATAHGNGHSTCFSAASSPNVFSTAPEPTATDMDIDPANDGDGVPIPPSTTAIPSSKNPTSTRQQQQQQTLNNEALLYGRELQREFKDDPRREVKEALEETFALIAYPDARESSLGFLLEEEGRVPVAEELNGAILVSLGQSSSAALERVVQQADVLAQEISGEGGGAALLNLRRDFLR